MKQNKNKEITEKVEKNQSLKETKVLPKENNFSIVAKIFMIIAVVTTTIWFFAIIYKNINDIKGNILNIISSFMISIFIILFIAASFKNDLKSKKTITASAIIVIAFTILNTFNFSHALPTTEVINFTNMSVTKALEWGKENNIVINQNYDNSDYIDEYNVMYQDVKEGTNVENINEINLTISEGPNYDKQIIFPNAIGQTYDEVINNIDKYLLNNVNLIFIKSDETKDIVLDQSISGQMRRNDEITITLSRGNSDILESVTLADLTNLTLFKATAFLKRNSIQFEINYEFNNNIKRGNVIKMDKDKNTTIDPNNDKVVLTVSKGKEIKVPNLLEMNNTEVTEWIIINKLKVVFNDKYDANTKLGKVISASVKENDILEEGTSITITISKGSLIMPKLTSLNAFKEWATKYNITYNEEREFNDTIANNEIIKFSHKEGQVIKNEDTVTVYVSQGKAVSIPNFIGMSKTNISSKCVSSNLICYFSYGSFSDSIKKDIATSQSKTAGSKAAANSTINITLSRGPVQKVTVPNFIGMSKTNISSKCNSIGLSCSFIIGSFSTTYGLNVAMNQSVKSNTIVTQGTKITITLSKGSAKTYTGAVIQSNWFVTGNSSSSISAIKTKLNSLYPKINFTFTTVADDGLTSGMVHPSSSYKADTPYTFTEGNTYNIKIVK